MKKDPSEKIQNRSQLLKSQLYCGTSNISLPVSGKAFFPPAFQDKSRLHYYASLFNSLEVNSSFYRIPMAGTVAKWAEDVPDDFTFTFKLWRGITHSKGLIWEAKELQRFLIAIEAAAEKKGCILVQFPPGIQYGYMAKVGHLLSALRQEPLARDWRIAVEFRHSSWYREETFHLLETNQMAMVQHDMPASKISFPDIESDFVFLRFHGENGNYRGSYSDDVLNDYADYLKDCLQQGKMVFAYFNNTMGDAVQNAMRLRSLYESDNH